MANLQALLELRTKIKDKKPEFIRQDYGRRIRIKREWRKPKGVHSKIRHHFKGRRKMPSPGYKSPVKTKGLHKSGLKMVRVFSVGDLQKIDRQKEGIIVSKSVGLKKRFDILKKANERGLSVLDLNVKEQIKKIEEFVKSRKKVGKEIKDSKEVKREDIAEKAKTEDAAKPKTPSDEGKKEAEKKEMEKVLIKKS